MATHFGDIRRLRSEGLSNVRISGDCCGNDELSDIFSSTEREFRVLGEGSVNTARLNSIYTLSCLYYHYALISVLFPHVFALDSALLLGVISNPTTTTYNDLKGK